MNHLARFALLAALAAALAGCGDDKKAKATFTRICHESSERMSRGDDGDFEQRLENALRSCSGACDLGDGESCTLIADHVQRLCKVSPGMCEELCKMSSPSLKKNACAPAAAPPPATN